MFVTTSKTMNYTNQINFFNMSVPTEVIIYMNAKESFTRGTREQ